MRFKTCSLLLFVVFLAIDGINGKRFGGFGRSSISHTSSYGGRTSSRGTSGSRIHSTNSGSLSSHRPASTGHTSTAPQKPIGFGTSAGGTSAPRPIGSPSGPVTPLQHKNINTHFLNAEGGGASRPTQTKPSQTQSGNSYPIGPKPGLTTESRQTSSGASPYVPKDPAIRPSTGQHLNQGNGVPYPPGPLPAGQANPPWSNPYLGANRPAVSSQAQPSWSNPHFGGNQPAVSSQAQPSWSNPHFGGNQPIRPGVQPPPYGFKDSVYPQAHPASPGSQFGQPHIGGHPSYPQQAAPSGPWPAPSFSAPAHQPSAMPFGNPYSLHPPGNAYNAPGQAYYPQQSHVLAQPAMQPFVPGQTIVMMPGQQDSGRGFGQMVKEALVFSTINAGVNRVLNPHTHHYVESRPAESAPTSTTHVTYNNQYFNAPPGANGTMNPPNVAQGNGPTDNPTGTYAPNAGTYAPNAGTYTPNTGAHASSAGTGPVPSSSGDNVNLINNPNNRVSSPSGAATGTGVTGRIVTPTTQSNVSNNQGNSTTNANTVDNTLSYRISDDELAKITEDLFAKSPNISKYIKLNLQNHTTSPNVTDGAKYPLFEINPELLDFPSISVTRTLYDSYEHDYRKKLNRTLEIREHENLLIDTYLNTNVMATTMQWLADRGFIDPDDFERKDVIRRIWFTMFSGSSCGFERVFASENYGTAVIGVQDWVYFENQETLKRIDYMGYVDKLNLGSTSSLLKLNFQMDGVVRPNATIFVGTMPELEMSLYTICFYARPNNACPVSLGGTKFNVYTHAFTYFGNDVIDLALPLF